MPINAARAKQKRLRLDVVAVMPICRTCSRVGGLRPGEHALLHGCHCPRKGLIEKPPNKTSRLTASQRAAADGGAGSPTARSIGKYGSAWRSLAKEFVQPARLCVDSQRKNGYPRSAAPCACQNLPAHEPGRQTPVHGLRLCSRQSDHANMMH